MLNDALLAARAASRRSGILIWIDFRCIEHSRLRLEQLTSRYVETAKPGIAARLRVVHRRVTVDGSALKDGPVLASMSHRAALRTTCAGGGVTGSPSFSEETRLYVGYTGKERQTLSLS